MTQYAYDNETGNRVRAKFNHHMVCHIWAQNSQTYGEGFNIYFEGATLYSYGSHFPLGQIQDDGAALMNSSGYSVSTSKHKSYASSAVSHRTTFYYPDLAKLLTALNASSEYRRANIRAYLNERILDISDDAALYVLRRCGLASSLNKIRRDAEQARDKQQKARDKRKFDDAKALLIVVADQSGEPAMIEFVASQSRYDWETTGQTIDSVLSDIRKARRAVGKGVLSNRRWSATWIALSQIPCLFDKIDAAIAKQRGITAQSQKNKQLQRSIGSVRLHSTNFDSLAGCTDYEIARAILSSMRNRASYMWNAAEMLRRRYPKLAKRAIDTMEKGNDQIHAYINACYDHTTKLHEAHEAQKAERLEQQRRQDWQDWIDGKPIPGRFNRATSTGGVYIRATQVERDDTGKIIAGNLQTSQGVSVPLIHAVKAFRFIKLIKQRGHEWHANGQQVRVGQFGVDRIDSAGNMRAGCHKFDWDQIEQLATDLGVFDVPASDDAVSLRKAAA